MVDVNKWYNDELVAVLNLQVVWHLLMHWRVGGWIGVLFDVNWCNDELVEICWIEELVGVYRCTDVLFSMLNWHVGWC